MISLNFGDFNLTNHLENPIIMSLLLSLIISLIMFFIIANLSFTNLQKIFISSLICSYVVLWLHFKTIKKKYYHEIIDKKEIQVLNKALPNVTFDDEIFVNE
jgi:hypothetical protein